MAPAFAMMMTGEAAWAGCEALELLFVEIEAKRPLFELRVAGAVKRSLREVAQVHKKRGTAGQPRALGWAMISTTAECSESLE